MVNKLLKGQQVEQVSQADQAKILNRLKQDKDNTSELRIPLRQVVLADELLNKIEPLEEMLRRGLVFELPVPKTAIATICTQIPNLDHYIDRAIALGLLEVSPNEYLRVPRILPLKLSTDVEALYSQAAQVLYRIWWVEANGTSKEQRLEIHRLALLSKEREIAARIAIALINEFLEGSQFRQAAKICRETLKIVKNYRILHYLARCEKELGNVDKALKYYQLALNLCAPEDEREKAIIIHNLAFAKVHQGQLDEAIALFEESLEIEERIGHIQGKAVTLHGIARLYTQQGQTDKASTFYRQSLKISKQIGDRRSQAWTLYDLADIYVKQGQLDKAITRFEKSLVIFQRLGNIQGKALTLHGMARVYTRQGQIDTAISLYQQSLEVFKRIGDVKSQAGTLRELADAYAQKGQTNEALTRLQQALELNERINYVQGKAATLHHMATIQVDQGQLEKALSLYQQSLELEEPIGDIQGQAWTLNGIAGIYTQWGQTDTALILLGQALELSERINYVQGKAATLHEIAGIYAQQQKLDEALALYQQSLELQGATSALEGFLYKRYRPQPPLIKCPLIAKRSH